jgi:hypothetical protein
MKKTNKQQGEEKNEQVKKNLCKVNKEKACFHFHPNSQVKLKEKN